LLDEGATLAQQMNDPIMVGRCLAFRGIIETYLSTTGEFDECDANATATRAANLLDTTTDAWGQALTASQIGTRMRQSGQYHQAEEILA
jgi:hypothetical protein